MYTATALASGRDAAFLVLKHTEPRLAGATLHVTQRWLHFGCSSVEIQEAMEPAKQARQRRKFTPVFLRHVCGFSSS